MTTNMFVRDMDLRDFDRLDGSETSTNIDCAFVPVRNSCPPQGQALVEPAGTCSGTVVPASRIPTRCVGVGCFCGNSEALMLSTKLSPQPSSSVSYLSACWSSP